MLTSCLCLLHAILITNHLISTSGYTRLKTCPPLAGIKQKWQKKKKKTVDTREGSAWGSCRKGSSALMIAVIYIHLFNTNIVIIAFLFCYIYPKFHPHKYSFQPPGSVSLLNGIVYVTHLESTLNMLSTGFVFFQRRNILADPYLV